jgi:hypothetical protein
VIRRGLGTQDRLEAQRRALDLYQAVGALQKDPGAVPSLLQKRARTKASQRPQERKLVSERNSSVVALASFPQSTCLQVRNLATEVELELAGGPKAAFT